jgi:AhpD family alkylhydroperoxidase
MRKRFSIEDAAPQAFNAMLAITNYVKTIQLNQKLIDLINIRVSEINGCSYCINMHVEHALRSGEDASRIFLLPAWKQSNLFSAEEQAVLQLAEEVTNISIDGVTDDTYNNLLKYYNEKTIAEIIMIIAVINSWNRIVIASQIIYQ